AAGRGVPVLLRLERPGNHGQGRRPRAPESRRHAALRLQHGACARVRRRDGTFPALSATLLAMLVDTSKRVGETASRRAKVAPIAEFLRGLAPDEIALGVSHLAGATPQGRTGIGYALIRDARPASNATQVTLTLTEVDAALGSIASASGAGSARERLRLMTG